MNHDKSIFSRKTISFGKLIESVTVSTANSAMNTKGSLAFSFANKIRGRWKAWHHYISLKLQFLTLTLCQSLHWWWRSLKPHCPISRYDVLQRNLRPRRRSSQTYAVMWVKLRFSEPKVFPLCYTASINNKIRPFGRCFTDPKLHLKSPIFYHCFPPGLLQHWYSHETIPQQEMIC